MADTTTIARRRLGKSALQTAPIVLGGNVFGWTADEQTSGQILEAFLDAGFNMVDTADSYSKWVEGHQGGESETIIGKWLKQSGRRAEVLIATKVGSEMGPGKKGLSKAYILREVEDSLNRLQTDYIDLYQSHIDDTATPLEETLAAYEQLMKQGKVRAIGASNYTAARLREALQVSKSRHYPRYDCLQPLYNLYDRSEFEGKLQRVCLEQDVAVIPYFSLASGFLTAKYRRPEDAAGKARGQFVAKFFNDRGFRILGALDEVARKDGATPAQVALAWLIAQPGVTAPIASATSLTQLEQILGAATLKLEPAALQLLTQASA